MYAFLVILGAVATATGFALISSGVPVHEFGLGSTLILAGTMAAVGGVLLIGIGLAVRELQRIERALAGRPVPRANRPAEASAVVAAVSNERPTLPARIPFPAKPKPDVRPPAELTVTAAAPAPVPEPMPAPAPVPVPVPAPAAVEETAFDRLRQKFPSLARIESAPVVEATEVSLSPRAPPRVDEYADNGHHNGGAPVRTNGADHSEPEPRLEAPVRPAPVSERQSKIAVFDSFWPKDGRRGRQGAEQPAAGEPTVAVAPHEPERAPRQPDYHAVSILKSGVVDGMAYTLYSDGSIEAQLPQGTVRFGSITELRLHLEKHG